MFWPPDALRQVWSLLSPVKKFKGKKGSEQDSDSDPYLNHWVLVSNTSETYVLYCVLGVLGLMAVDTLHMNAGGGGFHLSERWHAVQTPAAAAVYALRVVVAVLASVLLWVGSYALLDLLIEPNQFDHGYDLACDLALILCGFGGLAAQNTLPWVSGLYPSDEFWDTDPTPADSFTTHAWYSLKATVSIFLQSAVWLGLYDMLENYASGGSLGAWRECTWLLGGLWLLAVTDTTTCFSWVDEAEGLHHPALCGAVAEDDGEGEDGDDVPLLGDEHGVVDGMAMTAAVRQSMVDAPAAAGSDDGLSGPPMLSPSDVVFFGASAVAPGGSGGEEPRPGAQPGGIELRPLDGAESPPPEAPRAGFWETWPVASADISGSAAFRLRCVVSIVGQMMNNTGVWTLLDVYVPNTQGRALIYAAAGIAGMAATGSFFKNFGVPSWTRG